MTGKESTSPQLEPAGAGGPETISYNQTGKRGRAETISVPKALAPYITASEDGAGILLNPHEYGGLAAALLILPEKRYHSWHSMFPASLNKALESRFKKTRRLLFLVEGMPANAPVYICDGKAIVHVFFSGYGYSIPCGEWIGEPPEALPIIPYTDITRLIGSEAPQTVPVSAEKKELLKEAPAAAATKEGITLKIAEATRAASLPEAEEKESGKRTPEPLGAKTIPASQFRDFIPEGMRNAHRWGVVRADKKPYEGGAPEWHMDFEEAIRQRDELCNQGSGVHERVLGYCFGGISNRSTEPAVHPEHGNLTPEEAKTQGKPVGALYMRPDPRYGCIDYDHVLNPETGELRDDLAADLVAEITTLTSAWPTEVSASGTGLHIIFQKREGWPQEFGKNKQTFPQIKRKDGDGVGRDAFAAAGYVNFTGDQWKKDQKPATQEQKDAAYEMVLGIVNDYLRKKGKRAGPVSQPATMPHGTQPEGQRALTVKEQKILRMWMDSEANKVAIQMTRERIGYTADSQASEAMMAIMARIMRDAAEDAVKHDLPFEAYARPEIIRKLWEMSGTYRELYASGKHDYNESKITLTIEKAIGAGWQRYNELETAGKTRAKTRRKAEKETKEEPSEEQPEYTEEEAAEARKIYKRGEMLEYLERDIHTEHTGDDTVVRVMLLSAAGIKVINSEGIHIAVVGAAGTGKSHAAKTVTKRMPQSMVLSARMSNKALYHHKIQPGTILVLDDQEMSPELQEVMKSATTAWDEPEEYISVADGKPVTLETPPRSPWWVIKANITGDEQVLDRQIVLWADDSPEQRRTIIAETKRQLCNPDAITHRHGVCKALWGCLPTVAVTIPYEENIGTEDTIEPRNLKLFIDLIKSHALMHAQKRDKDEQGRIIAAREDFDAAAGIMNPILKGKGGSQRLKLTPTAQKVLDYLAVAGDQSDTIPFGDIITGVPIPEDQLTHVFKGRHDGRHDTNGLAYVCPCFTIVPYQADDSDGKRKSKKAVEWNREAYHRWKQGDYGFYWIESVAGEKKRTKA